MSDDCPLDSPGIPHNWITRRKGGDPTSEASDEEVTYCTLCGAELSLETSLTKDKE